MVGAYAGLQQRYCGLACGKHVRLQLPLFTAIVTTSAMYAGELWGVHPRSAAQRRMTAQKHSKFLRQLIRVSPSHRNNNPPRQSLTTCPCKKGGCRLPFASGMRWLLCRWTTCSVTYCMIVCRMQDRQGRAMLGL